jgi:DNA polymerase III, delta subunit
VNVDHVLDLVRRGRLYPAVILFGSTLEDRRAAALQIARALLCEADAGERPCGRCRHCRRVEWPGGDRFHPDLHVLERDLRTSTSVEATRGFLRGAYEAPFEARGQVFVIAEAETLSDGAADAFLKILEEPPTRSPRHFLLLAPTRHDLLPTLRSRSLSVFLGSPEPLDEELVDDIAARFGQAMERWLETSSAIYLFAGADALAKAEGWQDLRARKPWATAAAAIVKSAERQSLAPHRELRRKLLAVAAEILDGPRMRVRNVTPARILEGLLARHLG